MRGNPAETKRLLNYLDRRAALAITKEMKLAMTKEMKLAMPSRVVTKAAGLRQFSRPRIIMKEVKQSNQNNNGRSDKAHLNNCNVE